MIADAMTRRSALALATCISRISSTLPITRSSTRVGCSAALSLRLRRFFLLLLGPGEQTQPTGHTSDWLEGPASSATLIQRLLPCAPTFSSRTRIDGFAK